MCSEEGPKAQALSDFFKEKIEKIWKNLENTQSTLSSNITLQQTSSPQLSTFRPVSEAEICKIIKKMKTATCELDPIPTAFVKEHLQILSPIITHIVNSSILNGVMPSCLKTAIVIPRLKKNGLDCDDLKNFRPISNLPFLSKVIEKVVASQLIDHMDRHHLHNEHQSAYRVAHSTETALLKVREDVLAAMSNKKGMLMVLLDLSAAFDTVNHVKLLDTLQKRIGLNDVALSWFKS